MSVISILTYRFNVISIKISGHFFFFPEIDELIDLFHQTLRSISNMLQGTRHTTPIPKAFTEHYNAGSWVLRRRWQRSHGVPERRSCTSHSKRSGRFPVGGGTQVGKNNGSLAQQKQEGQRNQRNSRCQDPGRWNSVARLEKSGWCSELSSPVKEWETSLER